MIRLVLVVRFTARFSTPISTTDLGSRIIEAAAVLATKL
jgi:hypothetical protein